MLANMGEYDSYLIRVLKPALIIILPLLLMYITLNNNEFNSGLILAYSKDNQHSNHWNIFMTNIHPLPNKINDATTIQVKMNHNNETYINNGGINGNSIIADATHYNKLAILTFG